jgi:hemoglobin-like flavoprotein
MANDLGYGAPPTELQPRALDPGALQVIRQSADRLAQMEYTFIRQLHYDVTRLIPDAAGTSAADIWVFCERMVQSLLWVALTDQPPQVIIDTLRQVGARNRFEGFPDAQYVSVAHALVRTVRDLSGNDWSASTGSAWISYFMWIKPHLLAGARQAVAEQAAAQAAAAQQAAAQHAAAEQEAARVEALSRDSHGGHTQVVGDVNLESVASLLDDEDDEDVGYGQIMVSMTRTPRRDPPRHTD